MEPQEIKDFCNKMQDAFTKIEESYENTKRFYQRLLIACMITAILAIASWGRANYIQGLHETKIQKLEETAITYEQFILFNRSWELQMEHHRADQNGNTERAREIDQKYNELRSMIATVRTRGQQ